MKYEVWAEAFPDEPSFSARIVRVRPEIWDEGGFTPVESVTCVPRDHRDTMSLAVEELFRVFVDLPDEDEVAVHLTWLEEVPPGWAE